MLPPGMYAVQNDALRLEDTVICGTRGWTLPGEDAAAEDEKIYRRELQRMEMSLQRAKALGGRRLIVMCHYPPLGEGGAVTGEIRGIRYHCVSCDGLGFRVYRLP